MSTIEEGHSALERRVTVSATRPINFAELFIVLNGLIPLLMLAYDARNFRLGANPISNALHTTGMLSLLFLVATLTITPLQKWTKWNGLFYFRRPLGLYAFLYAVMHLMIYIAYDRSLMLSEAWNEFLQRRYLQVGAVALLLMVPLAVTSTPRMVKLLGFERWKLLHRLIYFAAIASVIHYYMQVKIDVRLSLLLGVLVVGLISFRVLAATVFRKAKIDVKAVAAQGTFSNTLFQIHFTESQQEVSVAFDMTILEAAESIGIAVPFECRAGICGTCRVQLLEGLVRMDTIDGISKQHMQDRFVLACQAKCRSNVCVRL